MEGEGGERAIKETAMENTMGKLVIGVCAMDVKARSKPMRMILDRLLAYGDFEVIVFGDQVIREEPPDCWPRCDLLMTFYSAGFPLAKAVEYCRLRRPYSVNDVPLQYLLLDRRLVSLVLDAIDVPTPSPRLFLNRRDSRVEREGEFHLTTMPAAVEEALGRDFNINVRTSAAFRLSHSILQSEGGDTLEIDGQKLRKPFVEKPVDANDHNIYIYYSGGGVRRLFRKTGNRSSEYIPGEWKIRPTGSYIYEQFLEPTDAEDVKCYTVGLHYAHAECRRAPSVGGLVRRDPQGKELRTVTPITAEESDMAQRVSMAFGQTICGLDLLRSGGRSYIVDVNGWSFVKGNETYWERAAAILRELFLCQRIPRSLSNPRRSAVGEWRLKAVVAVFRHADRTPKLKLKVSIPRDAGNRLFRGVEEVETGDVIIRGRDQLLAILETAERILATGNDDGRNTDKNSSNISGGGGETAETMGLRGTSALVEVLRQKADLPGTRLQIRRPDRSQTHLPIMVIVKWGGDFTHAGRHQARELGESLRQELLILNRAVLNDVRLACSGERRVVATAQVFGQALLETVELPPSVMSIQRRLLDEGTGNYKDLIETVKRRLGQKLVAMVGGRIDNELEMNSSGPSVSGGSSIEKDYPLSHSSLSSPSCAPSAPAPCSAWSSCSALTIAAQVPPEILPPSASLPSPHELLIQLKTCLSWHRQVMQRTLADPASVAMPRWCCADSLALFRERWERHFADILDGPSFHEGHFDPSKLSDLYDSLKFDALHHRRFLEAVFLERSKSSNEPEMVTTTSAAVIGKINKDGDNNTRRERLFISGGPSPTSASASASAVLPSTFTIKPPFTSLEPLYKLTQQLFNYVAPREYGTSPKDALLIGQAVSGPLLAQVITDLEEAAASPGVPARCRLYFTKESHMTALLNILRQTDELDLRLTGLGNELDYLSHLVWELYERTEIETNDERRSGEEERGNNGDSRDSSKRREIITVPNAITGGRGAAGEEERPSGQKDHDRSGGEQVKTTSDKVGPADGEDIKLKIRYSLRLGVSQGAHCADLLDIQVDRRHALGVQPKRWLTEYMEASRALGILRTSSGSNKSASGIKVEAQVRAQIDCEREEPEPEREQSTKEEQEKDEKQGGWTTENSYY